METKRWTPVYIVIIFRIALSVVDTITDLDTMYRYSCIKSLLVEKALYGTMISIILHNIFSSVHGLIYISRFHKKTNIMIWRCLWWKGVTLFAHVIGLGNVMLPLDIILSGKNMDKDQLEKRFVKKQILNPL